MSQCEQAISPAPAANISSGPLASCGVCFGFAHCYFECSFGFKLWLILRLYFTIKAAPYSVWWHLDQVVCLIAIA